jgi:glycosyltransferase involved in cell wall biosynthesis
MVFSIAVPVRGHARYLPTALASIYAQSASIELSVMDATPDQSVQNILGACGGHIHYSRHGADDGQSAAIQEGWNHTAGDIVGWLCADDYLFPDALAVVGQLFCERPDVDVVYGDGVFIDQDDRFIRYFPNISTNTARLTRDCCITQPSCFVRRSAIERVGGLRSNLHYVMDWDLWTRLYLAGSRFQYVKWPLSASRMHPGTKTTSNSSARIREIWRHLARHNWSLTAMRSMVGIGLAPLVYEELGPIGRSVLARIVRWAGNRARECPRGVRGRPARTLYGLEIGTNVVRRQCEVHLAFYRSQAASRFVAYTKEEIPLTVAVDGNFLVAASVAARRHEFEIPADDGRRQYSYRFELASPAPREWTLVSAHLE